MSDYLAKLSAARAPVKDALSPLGLRICQDILLALWGRHGYRDPRPMPIGMGEGGGATLCFEGADGRSFIVCLRYDGLPVYCVHEDGEGRAIGETMMLTSAPAVADFARACFGGEE